MEFQSGLARKIASKRKGKVKAWSTYSGLIFVVFIVLTLTSSTTAAPSVVIHIGTQSAFAKYLGNYEYSSDVLQVGVRSQTDWVCIKVQFNGKLSELSSISFSDNILQSGGIVVEPYVVIKLTEGKTLVCNPCNSYDLGWYLPWSEWQSRDTVSKGRWTVTPAETKSLLQPLESWMNIFGDRQVTNIYIYIGTWTISSPFQCYIGDFAINGVHIDIANAKRCLGSSSELPVGF